MSLIVLAYSGDFESNVMLKWLQKGGHEVVCFIADVGQEASLDTLEEQATRLGAVDVIGVDLRHELLMQFLFPALKANARYEGVSLLGDALVTALIAKHQVETAIDVGTLYLCHAAQSKSIGQMRFELAYKSILPKVEVVSPWRDSNFLQRCGHASDRVAFARTEGIPLPAQPEHDDSINSSMIQRSVLSEPLQLMHQEVSEAHFDRAVDIAETPSKVVITFENGIPVAVEEIATGKRVEGAVSLFTFLDELAGQHGVGREDVVVNRWMGIKWREIYEAPAATVLWQAHRDLEGLALDKQVLQTKEQLSWQIADCLYNGLCFSPELRLLMAAVEDSQEDVTGKVTISLFKGASRIVGRETVLSRYCTTLNRMEQSDAYNMDDVKGYLHIQSLRLQQRSQ